MTTSSPSSRTVTAPDAAPGSTVDEARFRHVMSAVCAPVTVITATTDAGTPHGTTVSSFSSLSLRPAMVVFSLDHRSELLVHLRTTGRAGVNLLGHDQAPIAGAFAGKGTDKFGDQLWTSHGGLPRLDGVAGWIAGSVANLVTAGDHELVLLAVEDVDLRESLLLSYAHRCYGTHTPLE